MRRHEKIDRRFNKIDRWFKIISNGFLTSRRMASIYIVPIRTHSTRHLLAAYQRRTCSRVEYHAPTSSSRRVAVKVSISFLKRVRGELIVRDYRRIRRRTNGAEKKNTKNKYPFGVVKHRVWPRLLIRTGFSAASRKRRSAPRPITRVSLLLLWSNDSRRTINAFSINESRTRGNYQGRCASTVYRNTST